MKELSILECSAASAGIMIISLDMNNPLMNGLVCAAIGAVSGGIVGELLLGIGSTGAYIGLGVGAVTGFVIGPPIYHQAVDSLDSFYKSV